MQERTTVPRQSNWVAGLRRDLDGAALCRARLRDGAAQGRAGTESRGAAGRDCLDRQAVPPQTWPGAYQAAGPWRCGQLAQYLGAARLRPEILHNSSPERAYRCVDRPQA